MPIYTMLCDRCGVKDHYFARAENAKDAKCPKCGEKMEKQISAMARTPGKWTVERSKK